MTGGSGEDGGDGRRWRVLVVEDEPDLRELICLTLSFDGRLEVVRSVGSAEDALESAEPVDLVVLDHWLGGTTNGLQVATALRGRWPAVRVLLFTAVDDVDVDLRDTAIDAVLSKPELVRLPEVALGVMSD